MSTEIRCDMIRSCEEPIAYVDAKGYVYCKKHGLDRKAHMRCRKLRPSELKKIVQNEREARMKNETYMPAKERAQKLANELGFDHGIEWLGTFSGWRVFMLPQKQNRYGHELRCEVVSCTNLATCQKGHGP